MPSLNTGNAILSNPIKVDSSYNVGIGGAASGSFKLQVTGTTNLTGALTGTSAVFSSSVQSDFLVVGTTAASSGGLRLGTQVAIRARNVANTANIPLIESTATDGVSVSNGALILASTGAATLSATDSTGNRVNPFNTLTITTDNPNLPYGFFGGSILFRNRSYTSGVVDSSRIRSVIYDDGAPNNFGGGLWFETTPTPGGTLTPSLIINYQGNVGIGTTTPTGIAGYKAITLSGTDGSFVDFRFNNSGYGRVFTNVDTALGMESLSTTLPLVFKTQNGSGSTERMRITSGGIVLINTTTNKYATKLEVNSTGDGLSTRSDNGGAALICNPATTGSNSAFFQVGTTNAGSISHPTSSTTSYNTSPSDERLKYNIEEWNENVLESFKAIKPKTYAHIADNDESIRYKGYIAQEMIDKFPEAYPKDKDGFYYYNPSAMIVYLTKAIQELEAKITQ